MKKLVFRSALLRVMTAAFLLVSGVSEDVSAQDEQLFRFLFIDGEQYRILSVVDQDVYINERFSHSAEILNRISVEVFDLGEGIGRLRVAYDVSEENMQADEVFQLSRSFETEYRQNELGFMDVPRDFVRPMVRDVPVFPEYPIVPGTAWSNSGTEVHDLSESFQINERFEFRIPVVYQYLGVEEVEGRTMDVLSVRYSMFHRFPRTLEGMHPVAISGFSSQRHYWDRLRGRIHSYEEEYEIMYTLSTGDTVSYQGTAEARVVETNLPDRTDVLDRLRERLQELNIPDTDVRESDRGITVSLEDIQFPPESAQLLPSEMDKLDRIIDLLSEYPDTDLLITGHTALAGTPEGRQRLSEARAAAVGNYLLQQGARSRDQLIFRGVGGEEPVAPNTSEEGRRRNRRVEFTILQD